MERTWSIGQLVAATGLAAKTIRFYELLPEHEPHAVREVYPIQWEDPQLVVDITDMMDLNLKAIACHAIEGRVRARGAALGKAKGYACAEGFNHIVLPG